MEGERIEGEERAAAWVLWQIRGVRHRHIRGLRGQMSLSELWSCQAEQRTAALERAKLGKKTRRQVVEAVEEVDEPRDALEREVEALPPDTSMLHRLDEGYPRRLYDLEDPPEFLYVRGRPEVLSEPSALSVVGSRDVSVDDANRAFQLSRSIASSGVVNVSSGALGDDRMAHRGAIEAGRRTVSVLPGGIDRPTPVSNRDVFEGVAENGALVTEYPIGVRVRRYHFPRRNRLIAALGDATFVVRAGPDSGTLLTAEAAREIGRPLCALVGGLEEPLAEGCLELIVSGAAAVRHADDVLDRYFPKMRESESDGERREPAGKADELSAPSTVSQEAADLVGRLREEGVEPGEVVRFDELEELTGQSAGQLQTGLLELELHGVCRKTPGANGYRFGAGGGATR